jgi:hypothetical protein
MDKPTIADTPLITAYTIGLGLVQPMSNAGFTLRKVVIEMDGREVTFNYDGGVAPPSSSTAPPPLPPVKMPPVPRVLSPTAPYPPPPPPRKIDTPAAPPAPPAPPPSIATVDQGVPFKVTKDMCIEPSSVPESERAPIWCIPPHGQPWPPFPPGYDPAKRAPVAPRTQLYEPVPHGLTLPPNPPVLPGSIAPPLIGNKKHMPVEGVFPFTDDDPCPLKKHKGERMGDVPADYLLYLADGWDRLRKQEPRMWAYVIRNRTELETEKSTNVKRQQS